VSRNTKQHTTERQNLSEISQMAMCEDQTAADKYLKMTACGCSFMFKRKSGDKKKGDLCGNSEVGENGMCEKHKKHSKDEIRNVSDSDKEEQIGHQSVLRRDSLCGHQSVLRRDSLCGHQSVLRRDSLCGPTKTQTCPVFTPPSASICLSPQSHIHSLEEEQKEKKNTMGDKILRLTNEKTEEIASQREEIASQREEIERQREEIASQREEIERQREEIARKEQEKNEALDMHQTTPYPGVCPSRRHGSRNSACGSKVRTYTNTIIHCESTYQHRLHVRHTWPQSQACHNWCTAANNKEDWVAARMQEE